MVNVVARLKKTGKDFEILVDLDKALIFKKTGQGSMQNILAVNAIFSDVKKGMHASSTDLQKAFSDDNIEAIASEIIKHGEVQLTEEHRKKEREAKLKQIIDWFFRNCIDPRTNTPHPPERIKSALSGVNVDERPVEEQIPSILKKLKEILPIKIETKKIIVKIPASYTGKAYGLLHEYKEKEEWLPDGSLSCICNLPAGMQLEFYDKLNSMTHGAAITQEVKE